MRVTPPNRSRPATVLLPGLVAAVLALASGCSGGEDDASAAAPPTPSAGASAGDVPSGARREVVPTPVEAPSTGAPILVPGRPGEPVATATPGQTVLPGGPQWNDADVAFAQGMVPHHAQALEMSALAPERAQEPRVREVAERIAAAQGPEIRVLAQWLDDRGEEVPAAGDAHDAHAGHGADAGHGGMAGMASPEEMAELTAARGAEFDRTFLQLMIRHHEGALTMGGQAQVDGSDPIIQEMSADVVTSQAAEIRRMQQLLDEL